MIGRRVLLVLLLLHPLALAKIGLVEGGDHAIYPDTVYFPYTEEALGCGALFDPLPAVGEPEPYAELRVNLAAGWGCANPEPYPGPNADHPEVVVIGDESPDGQGDPIYALVTVLDLHDTRLVSPSEANRIRADPERAIRVEIQKQLANMSLRYDVTLNGVAHIEVSQNHYGHSSPDATEEEPIPIPFARIQWVRVQPPSIQLGFRGYPILIDYSSRLFFLIWQWRAQALWVVVIRGRAHGNEPPGDAKVVLTIEEDDALVDQGTGSAQTLRVENGRLQKEIPKEVLERLWEESARLPLNGPKTVPKPPVHLY